MPVDDDAYDADPEFPTDHADYLARLTELRNRQSVNAPITRHRRAPAQRRATR